MPLLKKKTVVAAAIETVEGTPIAALDNTDVFVISEEITRNVEFTYIERNFVGPSFARKPGRATNKLARLTFRTEIRGSGTAATPPKWAPFLEACGFAEAVTTSVAYTPVVPTNETYGAANGNVALTIWVFRDGKAKKMKHCRGNVRVVGESGGLAYFEFDFLGVYVDSADVAYPDLSGSTFDSTIPPLVESAAFAFQDVTAGSAIIRAFTVDMGNNIVPRWDASSASGIKSIIITDSNTTATIDPEEPLVGETGWQSTDSDKRFSDNDVGAFSIVIGTAAGNKLTITAPAATVQVTGVSEGDRDGLAVDNVTLAFNAPDDEDPDVSRILFTHS